MTRTYAALDVSRAAERDVFRAFVIAERDELSRAALLDVLDHGLYSPSQNRAIARIDKALRLLVTQKRLVRVRKGVYSVVGRKAAA